jgi:hypothetical protein
MQRTYQGRLVRLTIDDHGHLWLDYGEGEVSSVPFVYHAGTHAIVLPLSAVHDLGPEAYGRFVLDAADQGIAVQPAVYAAGRAEWHIEEHEQERRES